MHEALPAAYLHRLVQSQVGAFRNRLYPPLTTLSLFIEQVLSADGACQDAVARHLSARHAAGHSACSLNTGPYCKARARLPVGLIERLALSAAARLEQRAPDDWRWQGRRIKLVDGTTVSMPDTPANQAAYPQSSTQKPGLGFPVMQLVGLVSLATGALLGWAHSSTQGKGSGEQALFRQLMPQLQRGDVVLVDRFHCTYFTIALLQARGVDILTRQHQRRLTAQEGIIHALGKQDHLVRWHRPKQPDWMDEATYAAMPEQLLLRQTEVGGQLLVSTLRQASVTPCQLHGLYQKRWKIEVDWCALKSELGMGILRGKSPAMVRKEIAVHLLAYNLIRALMARAATLAQVLPRVLSFKASVQLWRAFSQRQRWHCQHFRDALQQLITAISTRLIPQRPGRLEPHAIKRRPPPHDLLTVPRNQARQAIWRARNLLKVAP